MPIPAHSRRIAACAAVAVLFALPVGPGTAADPDTTPPAALDRYRVALVPVTTGIVSISAPSGATEPFAHVRIGNSRTGVTGTAYADSTGRFNTMMAAQRGDAISLTVRDTAGNLGPTIVMHYGAWRVKNPYRPTGTWYTGQTHVHSTNTDGRDIPRDLEAAYHDAGYDFVVSTDHRGPPPRYLEWYQGMTGDPYNGDRGKDLLWIAGTEIGTPEVHLGAWGNVQQVEVQYLYMIQTAIERIRALGGIAVMNHPDNEDPPKAWDWHTEILRSRDYSLVEAFNANPLEVAVGSDHLPEAVDLADAYQQVWWIGSDDLHDRSDPDWFDSWATIVQLPPGEAISQPGIIRAADAGRAYIRETAAGPVVNGVEADGATVTIRLDPAGGPYDVTWRRRGNEVAERDAGVGQSASYVVKGAEGYVRAEVVRRADGLRAYTQPMFIGNPADLAVAASHPALVDNNAATAWEAAHAIDGFVVDTGAVRQLNGIQVDWDGADGRRFDYHVETSETGEFLGEQVRVTRRTWSNDQALTVDFFDERARYVRVAIAGQSAGAPAPARVREVEVFDASPGGTALYIDNVAGDDANSGLAGSPWRTFNHARLHVRPRDTLHFVATGVPYAPLMELTRDMGGKHASARVTLTGDPVALTPVDATGTTFGFQLIEPQQVELSHFDIRGATSAGIRLQNVRAGTVLRNNVLRGATGRGLMASGKFDFSYNLVHGNATDGVFLQLDGTDARIFNNVIWGNTLDGVSLHTVGNLRAAVYNNVIGANGRVALRRGTNGVAMDGYNCLQGTVVGLWSLAANMAADPVLVDPAAGNFRLRATSPCIDAGLDLDQVADFAGNPVVDHPDVSDTGSTGAYFRRWLDIGAYEHQPPACCVESGGCHASP